MAIAPLEDRLTSMMSEQPPAASASVDIASEQSQPSEQYPTEGVQVAGLLDAPGDVIRVIKQGSKGKDVLKQIADSNANQIEILREQAAVATEAKKKAAIAEKAAATRVATKQETADVDALTGGALSAKTPEDRAAKLNTWLESNPEVDKIADVYKRIQKKDPASAALLESRLRQELPSTTAIPEANVNVTKIEPMLPEGVQATDRPDLIPVIDSTKVKAFLSGEAPDDIPLDISFQNIKSPEDIDYVIRKTEEIFSGEFYAAKRGVISDDELNSLATQMNMEADLLKRQVGTVFNAEQLQASKLIISASAKKIEDMRQQIKLLASKTENNDALLLDFTNQLAIHAAMQMNFKAAKSEAGRALRASRVYTDDVGDIDVGMVNQMIAEMGGANNIKNIATMMDLLNDAQKAKFIQQGGSDLQKFGNVWKEVYVSALMSAPVTFVNMFFGGLVNTLMRPIDSAFAATTGRAWDATTGAVKDFVWTKERTQVDEDFVSTAESAVEIANLITGAADAFRAASQAFKTDAPVYSVGKNIDTQPDPAITSKLFADPNSPTAQMVDFAGKAIRLPFRGALFVDEGTKTLASNMELRRIASREAIVNIRNGMSADDALLLMSHEITNPSAETLRRMEDAAKESALQQDLGGFGKWVMSTRKELDERFAPVPVGTVMAPFVKTVINAYESIMTRTPLAPIMSEVRTELQAGGARRQMALGKIHAGSAIMMSGLWLASNVDGPVSITGLGPSDPKKRQWLKENEGWQACSLKVNGKYYPMAGMAEPISGLMCSAATVAELGYVYGKDDDASYADVLLYTALLPFKYIGELPMMDSMGKFFDMLQQVTRDSSGEKTGEIMNRFFGGFTQNMVGGVAPAPMPFSALLRQMERTIDPTRREVTIDPSLSGLEKYYDFALRSWLAGTPLLSEELKPKRNFWGAEVEVGGWGKKEMGDDLSKTLRQLSDKRGRSIVNYPSRRIDNIQLNDNEYSDLLLSMNEVKLNGTSMRQQIASDLSFYSSETKNGAFAGLANKLSETVSAYRDEALKSPKMMVYTDLQKNIANNKLKADMHVDMIKREPKE